MKLSCGSGSRLRVLLPVAAGAAAAFALLAYTGGVSSRHVVPNEQTVASARTAPASVTEPVAAPDRQDVDQRAAGTIHPIAAPAPGRATNRARRGAGGPVPAAVQAPGGTGPLTAVTDVVNGVTGPGLSAVTGPTGPLGPVTGHLPGVGGPDNPLMSGLPVP